MLFVELQYTLATEEAERIGVDHVARMSTSDTGEGSSGMFSFICIPCMVAKKIHVFLKYSFSTNCNV